MQPAPARPPPLPLWASAGGGGDPSPPPQLSPRLPAAAAARSSLTPSSPPLPPAVAITPPSPLLAALTAHTLDLRAQMREVQAERDRLLAAAGLPPSAGATPLLAPSPSPRVGAAPQPSPLLALLSALPPAGTPPAFALPSGLGAAEGGGGGLSPRAVRRLLGGGPSPGLPPSPFEEAWGAGGGASYEGTPRLRRRALAAAGSQRGAGNSGAGEEPGPPQPPPQQANDGAPAAAFAEAAAAAAAPPPPPPPPPAAVRALLALNPGLLLRLGLMYFVLGQGATWERQCHIIGALAGMYLFGVGFLGWAAGLCGSLCSACAVRCCGAGAARRRATPLGGLTGALLAGRGYVFCDLVAALAAFLVSLLPGFDPDVELARA